jgi:DEAD/DEAH box helicase domain-containing protein
VSLAEYIESLKAYKGFAGDIVCHRTLDPVPARHASNPPGFTHDLSPLLEDLGISRLYAHQQAAMDRILSGRHTVIATPTASGKSLVYNLPVVDRLLSDPSATALYLFPLKALARDQLGTVQDLLVRARSLKPALPALKAAVYDGDVSSHFKAKIRRDPPQVLLSNPEMLHLAMLPHHHLWENFFRRLAVVVVDEVHTCRGVMGSHMAWVFRRLVRICRHYGADPVFVFCSATIANPGDLCGRLTGLPVDVVDIAGAPSGKKEVVLMRGMEGASQTAIALIHAAMHRKLRTIVYTQSRKITELIAIWASQRSRKLRDRISAYRAGFLPEERREIETRLATGDLLCVVSTSALELGIDIGNLDLCILVGYPGTIMSTWQRAGRVGRDGSHSALVLIAQEDALDQYFMTHPEVFFDMPPETALINPDNPVICRAHLVCAAADLPLKKEEPLLTGGTTLPACSGSGKADDSEIKKNRADAIPQDCGMIAIPAEAEGGRVQAALRELENAGKLLRSAHHDIWYAAQKNPHQEVTLRGTGRTIPIFLENTRKSLGEIDRHRAFFDAHDGAVYLHHGKSYVVTRFDHEKNSVEVIPKEVKYYTRAWSSKSTRIIGVEDRKTVAGTRVGFGRLRITEQVTGYDRKLVATGRSIGMVPLDLPPLEFDTQGLWIQIPDEVRDRIESDQMHFMGGIHAMEHAAIGIMPLLVMTDRNDLGGISIPFHDQVQAAAVFVYDAVPGGLGLCRRAFDQADRFLSATLDTITACRCDTGCPACVHSPKCGSGNRPIDKHAAREILERIIFRTTVSAHIRPDRIPAPVLPAPGADCPADPVGEGQRCRVRETQPSFQAGETVCVDSWQKRDPMNSGPEYSGPVSGPFPRSGGPNPGKSLLRYGVLDIETRRSAAEVGGWNRADKMGVSCAVLYDSQTGEFYDYTQDQVPDLCGHLLQLDRVVGFNLIKFDYKVLAGQCDFHFHGLPTLDILVKVHEVLGYRLSLDHLAQNTLGAEKSADGLMALQWWQQGEMDKIIEYCTQDVRVTRDLYRFGRDNRFLVFRNKAGHQVRVPVSW